MIFILDPEGLKKPVVGLCASRIPCYLAFRKEMLIIIGRIQDYTLLEAGEVAVLQGFQHEESHLMLGGGFITVRLLPLVVKPSPVPKEISVLKVDPPLLSSK